MQRIVLLAAAMMPTALCIVNAPVIRNAQASAFRLETNVATNMLAKGMAVLAAAAIAASIPSTAVAKMPAELTVGPESAEVVALRQKLFEDQVSATNVGKTGTDLKISLSEGALALKTLRLGPVALPIPSRIPTSFGVNLPVLGSIRADLDVRVKTGATAAEVAGSDVVVTLPKDLPKAAKLAAGGDAGVSIDAPGLLSGRVDLDLVTPRNGEADVAVTSSLITKLPLQKNAGTGRFCYDCGNGEQLSEWYVARNLNNGVSFYLNSKTGETTFQVPKGF